MNDETAHRLVQTYLLAIQEAMNADGSALPDHIPDRIHLVISAVEEHDFGWLFFYDSEEHQQTGDCRAALFGNAPLIVDRLDGSIHPTGTAHGIKHYLAEYRRQRSSTAQPLKPQS